MIYCNIHTHTSAQNPSDITIVNRIIREISEDIATPLQSAGIHPWYIYNIDEQLKQLKEVIKLPNIVAIGEAGLDKLAQTHLDIQKDIFIIQGELAEEVNKPLIIHCVKAWTELIAVKKQLDPEMPWIIHGFRGNGELANQLIHQGFYLSFGEYYNPEALFAAWPSRLFTETDDKNIGIDLIYKQITTDLNVSSDTFSSQIRENVQTIFSV